MTLSGLRRSRLRFVTVTVMLATYVAMLWPPLVKKASADILGPGIGGVELGAGGSTSLAQPTSSGQPGPALAETDLATGTAQSSFSFQLPKARGEAQPSLGLRYNSSARLGFAGMGWTLSVPSIVRRGTSGLPRFTDTAIAAPATLAPNQFTTDLNTDDYYMDGRLLIPTATGNAALSALPGALLSVVPDQWAAFRAEIDDGSRYFFNGQTWVQQTKSGHVIQFGYPLDRGAPCVEVADANTVKTFVQPTGWPPNPIYRWNIARDTDASGNTVYYNYDDEHGLFPVGSPPGPGIQYLTDIYDTSTGATSNLTAPIPAARTFAHHTHLSWSLAQYPATGPQPAAGVVPPYTYSPIWRALPYAQLARVDVTSATFSAVDGSHRSLVRSYQLSYIYNDTQTRAYLSSILPAGDCLSNGGPFIEGADGTLNSVVSKIGTCAQHEAMPATTYTYYGISPTPPALSPPFTLSKQPGWGGSDPARYLIDLDGDAVPELVDGDIGAGMSWGTGLVNSAPACNMTCSVDPVAALLSALGNVFFSMILSVASPVTAAFEAVCSAAAALQGANCSPIPSPPANCSKCSVKGPTLPGQAAPVPWTANSSQDTYNAVTVTHREAIVDDAMWMFAIPGDWAPTGKMSVLYVPYLANNPSLAFSPLPATLTIADSVRLGQFTFPQPGKAWLFSTPLSLPANDLHYIPALNGTPVGPNQPSASSLLGPAGLITPANAVDVDGDGLPDIDLVGQNNIYQPYLTTHDRAGTTHPFAQPFALTGPQYCAPSAYDPLSWRPTYSTSLVCTQQTPKSGCAKWGVNTVYAAKAIRAFADIDGDGLADLVTLNKSNGKWPTNVPSLGDGGLQPPADGGVSYTAYDTGPFPYLDFNTMPGRGDGRFGIPSTTQGDCTSQYGGGIPSMTASRSSASDPLGATNNYSTQSSAIQFGDLNGDGYSDYAVLDPDGLHVCLRYGGNWDTERYHCSSDPSLKGTKQDDGTSAQANILIGDLYGTGVNQVLYISPTTGGMSEITIHGSIGDQTTPVVAAPGPPVSGTTVVRAVTPSNAASLVNVNGIPMREGLIRSVSNGLGASLTFDAYDFVANQHFENIGPLPVPAWVVRQTTTGNGMSGAQAVAVQKNYAYDTAIYDPRDREFVGFRSVTVTTQADQTSFPRKSPGTVVKTTFATQTCQSNSTCGTPNIDYSFIHATRGLPAVVEESQNNEGNGADTKGYTTLYTYTFQTPYPSLTVDGRAGKTIFVRTTDVISWAEPANGTQSAQTSSFQAFPGMGFPSVSVSVPAGSTYTDTRSLALYDPNGNATISVDSGRVGVDQPIMHQLSWSLPAGDVTGWNWRMTQDLTGFGSSSLVAGAAGVREYDFNYDAVGRLVSITAPVTGTATLSSNSSVVPSRPPPLCGNSGCAGAGVLLRSLSYDPFGNVLVSGDQQNSALSLIQYDSGFHQLPTSELINAPQGALITTFGYDRGLGVHTSELSPDGQMTNWIYDDFGRVVEVDAPSPLAPGGVQRQVSVTYDDAGPVRHVHAETADGYALSSGKPVPGAYVKHDRYIDSFGQTLAAVDQVAATAAEGTQWLLSGVQSFYRNGRVNSVYRTTPLGSESIPARGALPAGVSQPSGTSATVTYDGMGRAVAGTDFLGHAWSTVYHPAALSQDSYDQEQVAGGSHIGAYTTVTKDGHGRVVNATLHKGSSTGADIVTTYNSYLATGEPTSITYGGVTRTMAYDSLGRMVTNNEPNSGTWNYTYDYAGRLTGTSDARGCGQNIWYDTIGRIVAKDYIPCMPDWRQGGVTQAPYTPPNLTTGDGTEAFYTYDGVGHLADEKDLAKHDVYGYDPRGRIQTIQRSVVAAPSSLNVYGAPTLPYFPSSATLANRYASNVFTKTINYDFSDRVLTATTGATAVTAMGNTESRTYSFDGRLQSVSLTSPATSTSTPLLGSHSIIYQANGSATDFLFYGDAAVTQATSTYNIDGSLAGYHLYRTKTTPWSNVSPAASNGDQTNLTQQSDLLNMAFLRDRVGNPTSITDSSTSTWPPGAAAVSQTFTYQNDYRLAVANSNANSDTFRSPTSPEDRPGYAYPNAFQPYQTNKIPTRFKNQTFTYDVRGNQTSSTDDLNDFWDRSLGTQQYLVENYYTNGPDQLEYASETPPDPNNISKLLKANEEAGNTYYMFFSAPAFYNGGTHIYYYDEVNRLSFAQMWQPEWFANDADGSVILSAHQLEAGYTVHVFDSLVLHDASFSNGTYEDDQATEQVYVGGGLAHVFYDFANALPKVNNNQTHAFMSLDDGRGSVGVVIDRDSSEVVERIAYQPYGAYDADYRPARWNYTYERLKYGWHWDNQEIGLINMGARYYSPRLGTFMTPDPLAVHGLGADPNPYAYANGNPIRYTDPTGLSADLSHTDWSPVAPFVWVGALILTAAAMAVGAGSIATASLGNIVQGASMGVSITSQLVSLTSSPLAVGGAGAAPGSGAHSSSMADISSWRQPPQRLIADPNLSADNWAIVRLVTNKGVAIIKTISHSEAFNHLVNGLKSGKGANVATETEAAATQMAKDFSASQGHPGTSTEPEFHGNGASHVHGEIEPGKARLPGHIFITPELFENIIEILLPGPVWVGPFPPVGGAPGGA